MIILKLIFSIIQKITNIKNRYLKLKNLIVNRIVNIEIFYNRTVRKYNYYL